MMVVEISGLDALERDLNAAARQAKAAADDRAKSGAERIADDMRARVPVDRGALRDSIRTEPARGGGTLIRAGGTRSTMKETDAGAFDEALSVEYGNAHSSTAPFFHNTIEAHRKGVESDIGEAADDAASEATR